MCLVTVGPEPSREARAALPAARQIAVYNGRHFGSARAVRVKRPSFAFPVIEMSARYEVPLNRLAWSRFIRVVKAFAESEMGWKARILVALLVLFLIGINGLNVISSYVGRDFMTAIANRDMDQFVWQAMVYVGVFGVCTVVAVVHRFCEERLGLLWRQWLTERAVTRYMEHPVYYRLDETGEVANPDQRIADDIKAFTVTTLSFVLMILNGSFTILAFSGVMWTISPLLFMVAVVYAVFGSYLTIYLGRPLVGLNYRQLDKEANFRADLIHVRENAESIATQRSEGRLIGRIRRHLDELVFNFRRLIGVNRNLGFFTTGYNYLLQVIPALIVAPMYIRGQVEFGVITQAAMAFTLLLGAFSLIVTQFQSISSFAAVISRLGALWEAIEGSRDLSESQITIVEENDRRLAYLGLTLRAPRHGEVLLRDLSLTVTGAQRVLICGPNERAKQALFRATAGIWYEGAGTIVRPDLDRLLMLPERPYLPPGTLREALLPSPHRADVPVEMLQSVLETLAIGRVVERAGGFDVERHWEDALSLGEQQLIVLARLLLANPHFAIFDRPGSALSPSQVRMILNLLSERSVGYLVISDRNEVESPGVYDSVLEIEEDGAWLLRPPTADESLNLRRRSTD